MVDLNKCLDFAIFGQNQYFPQIQPIFQHFGPNMFFYHYRIIYLKIYFQNYFQIDFKYILAKQVIHITLNQKKIEKVAQ